MILCAFVATWSLGPNFFAGAGISGKNTHQIWSKLCWNNSLQKVAHFLCSFFFSFSSFCTLAKNCHKMQIRNCQIWQALKGTSWYQIWFKYKQNWQSYKQFFTKNDTNMLLHLQDKPLIISNWKLASDSLNIKPQTFCGLMDIKEIVTEYKNWYH